MFKCLVFNTIVAKVVAQVKITLGALDMRQHYQQLNSGGMYCMRLLVLYVVSFAVIRQYLLHSTTMPLIELSGT